MTDVGVTVCEKDSSHSELETKTIEGEKPVQQATMQCPDCRTESVCVMLWYPDDTYVIATLDHHGQCTCGKPGHTVISLRRPIAKTRCMDCMEPHVSSALTTLRRRRSEVE